MIKKRELTSDFGCGITLDRRVSQAAAHVVAVNVLDPEEAKIVLDMLGLIPPQPGFEPLNLEKEKNQQAHIARQQRRRDQRAKES